MATSRMRAGTRDVWLGPHPLLEVKDPDIIAPVKIRHKDEGAGIDQGPQELTDINEVTFIKMPH